MNHPKGVPKWRHDQYKDMMKVVVTNSVNIMMIKMKKLHKSGTSKVGPNVQPTLMSFSYNLIFPFIPATLPLL